MPLHKGGVVRSLTAREVQRWWFGASSRALLAALCILAAEWIMHAKRPPPSPPVPPPKTEPTANSSSTSAATGEQQGAVTDLVAEHFAALRGDEGVSWDRQARSVLIDSAMVGG